MFFCLQWAQVALQRYNFQLWTKNVKAIRRDRNKHLKSQSIVLTCKFFFSEFPIHVKISLFKILLLKTLVNSRKVVRYKWAYVQCNWVSRIA